ncbi:stress responsive A/B barrel domain-containing protein [Papiliotrema laurentii]|uniref:Stress responsive A/B barrel domain-containing protein n=1 Tax=Papiliotrema laurentii TaxID=5418 RepID=A0AAD9FL14_PAPLA|nr:stress responsive A/B barrel domain-containing protein [Papiliotrema laurentii]
MPVTHIVAFNVPANTAGSLTSAFLDLKEGCKKDGQSYILSVKGGKQISPEPFHHDIKVVFIVEFATADDIAYYLDHDPVHDAFKQRVRAEWAIEGVVVLDFVDGDY